jgi:hypothetical protein
MTDSSLVVPHSHYTFFLTALVPGVAPLLSSLSILYLDGTKKSCKKPQEIERKRIERSEEMTEIVYIY